MEKADEQLELILSLPNTDFYSIVKSKKQSQENGVLNIYSISSQNLIVLIFNEFKFVLNDQIPVMVNDEKEPIRRYAFPYLNSNIGLTLSADTSQDLIDIFETIIAEHANLICPTNMSYADEKLLGKTDDGNKEVKPKDHEKSKKMAEYIAGGGDKIKDGLIKTGNYVSKQIKKGGDYLRQKLKKNKVETKVKEDTQSKVKFAKEVSKSVLTYTKAQIEVLLVLSKNIGSEIVKSVEKSDSAKKITSHKNYEDAKKIGGASIHALAAVYDGLFEAIFTMARGAKDATTEVVEHKYGKDAAGVLKDGLDTVGNVGYLTRAFKDVAVQEVQKSTEIKKK